MAGRPPKPTVLKILTGNPGHRKLNDKEPKPAIGAPPPVWIKSSPEMLAEWNRHAGRLTRLGLLTEVDDDALSTLCVLSLKFKELVEDGAAAGPLMWLSKELRALWSRFGMTPADRSRVKVEKSPPETKLSRFTNAAKA